MSSVIRSSACAFGILLVTACSSSSIDATHPTENKATIMLASDVEWTHLNPARGDKAPSAGTLWGNRSSSGPTGFLLKPSDGFESPPHIHNVSYRGVVIQGQIHNDDPDAENMWMPSGSFWTQPKGEVHITAAVGAETLAYIEIEEGPYLVHSAEDAFDSGERPVNVDESNIVWLDANAVHWLEAANADVTGPEMAFLWETPDDGGLSGAFLKLPAGFDGVVAASGTSFRAVVIQGLLLHEDAGAQPLEPGSYFSSVGAHRHEVTCDASAGMCLVYVRSEGAFQIMY